MLCGHMNEKQAQTPVKITHRRTMPQTAQSIKDDWAQMIESGQLTLGEPCAPYTLTTYIGVL